MKPRLIRLRDIGRQPGKVMADGGDLRVLQGSDAGVSFSVYDSHVVAGSGPKRHRHPHVEVALVHAGTARFVVEDEVIDAEAGDILIIPPNAWHSFANTGAGPLHETAIHDNARAVTEFDDGTHRG